MDDEESTVLRVLFRDLMSNTAPPVPEYSDDFVVTTRVGGMLAEAATAKKKKQSWFWWKNRSSGDH